MECLYKTTTRFTMEEYKKFNNTLIFRKQIWLIVIALLILLAYGIKLVSSAYLRLLIFLPAILIPACASYSPAFLIMYSAYKLNK